MRNTVTQLLNYSLVFFACW